MKLKHETLFVCFAAALVLCCFFTIVYSGDDMLWFFAYERDDLQDWRMPNGRYLSNTLTYLMVHYSVIRFVLFVPVLFGLIWLLCRGMQSGKKSNALTWCGLMLFCMMPAENWGENIMWTSAFPVYTLPLISVLLYLRFFFAEKPDAKKQSVLIPAGMLLMGFAGALCVEHMTILSCMLALFVLIYAAANKKLHIHAYQVTYAIGTAAGTVLMFLNENYHTIAAEEDTVGNRVFTFDASDIFFQMYKYVIPRFAKTFPVMHVLIAAGFLIMLLRADHSSWKPERMRYAKMTITCIAVYAFYSVFVNCCTDLVSLTPVMRMAALECALVFLYLVSIVYLSWVLMPREAFLRTVVYVVCAFVSSAVFCVVNPVSPRCFFSDFCFWLLCTQSLWSVVLQELPQIEHYTGKVMQISGAAAVCVLCYINVINKVSFDTSIRYMQEQCERGAVKIELIEQPYAEYSSGISLSKILGDWSVMSPETRRKSCQIRRYVYYLQQYYDLSFDDDRFGCINISYFAYNM